MGLQLMSIDSMEAGPSNDAPRHRTEVLHTRSLLDAQDMSWIQADVQARKIRQLDVLAIESGSHNELDKYFEGLVFIDKFYFATCAMRSTGLMSMVKHVSELTWICLQWEMGRVLGFGTIGKATCAWVAFNCYLKTLFQSLESHEVSMHNPDNALYKVIRMLPTAKRKEYHQQLSFFGGHLGIMPGHVGSALVATGMVAMATISVAGLAYSDTKTDWDHVVIVLDVVLWVAWPMHTFWMTPLFWVIGGQFADIISNFRCTELTPDDEVDVRMCFQNYFIMTQTIEQFTHLFSKYFFVVEFTLVLWFVFIAAALYDESDKYDGEKAGDIRIAMLVTFIFLDVVILGFIFNAAAKITKAADKCDDAHGVVWHATANDDPSSYIEHVHRTADAHIGFHAMGITINYSLMLRSMYFLSTAAAFVVTTYVIPS